MQDRLPALPLFRSFEAAARHLSFKLAAAELHVTPAAVSQQIKALEDQLGQPLFERLTRALRLTPQGEALRGPVREAFEALARGVQLARTGTAQQAQDQLTVWAPPGFASQWLVPRLPAFHALHPAVDLRLVSSPEAVDQAGAATVLAALDPPPNATGHAGSVLAIVYGSGRYAGHRVAPLLVPELLPVCAPGWLQAAPPLTEPADLCRATLIHDETLAGAGRGGEAGGWLHWLAAAGVPHPVLAPGRRYSNSTLAIEAALAGVGVALAAQPMVAQHLAAGTLLAPFPRHTLRSPFTYALVARDGVAEPPAAAAFRAWLIAAARPAPRAAAA
ncbi:transcriptional regulator GcvA [Ideonella azotifigens]|uniref:Transcriptional regulator GcvA n=1 Tax=Ideonella azotifigens TaxID=513160 RepID=A0ABN1KL37_9BURK